MDSLDVHIMTNKKVQEHLNLKPTIFTLEVWN